MEEKQLEERWRAIEEDIDRLREQRKDKWDKIQILLSVLIPISIAGAGWFFHNAEIEVAKIKLIHDFLEPLTDTTPGGETKRKVAEGAGPLPFGHGVW